jgi:serine/threonine-protein kinase
VAIESEPLDLGSIRPPALELANLPTREEPTRTTSVSTVEPRTRARRGVWVGAFLVVLGIAATAIVFASKKNPSTPIVAAPPASVAPTQSAEPEPEPAMPAPSASSPVAKKKESRSAPAVVKPRSKKNCNPPYTVDADGIQHFKRECL